MSLDEGIVYDREAHDTLVKTELARSHIAMSELEEARMTRSETVEEASVELVMRMSLQLKTFNQVLPLQLQLDLDAIKFQNPVLRNPGGGGLSDAVQRLYELMTLMEDAVSRHVDEIRDLNAVLSALKQGDSVPVLKKLWHEHSDQMELLASTHSKELEKLHGAFAEQLAKQCQDHDQELAALDYEMKLYRSKAEALLAGQASSEAKENAMLREALGRLTAALGEGKEAMADNVTLRNKIIEMKDKHGEELRLLREECSLELALLKKQHSNESNLYGGMAMAQAQEQELALHSLETQHTARLEKALQDKESSLKKARMQRDEEINELKESHAAQVKELKEQLVQAREMHQMQANAMERQNNIRLQQQSRGHKESHAEKEVQVKRLEPDPDPNLNWP